jgi:hypothetical protein
MRLETRIWSYIIAGLLILIVGFTLRTAGLFRGLNDDVLFHPDEAKQVSALFNYLNDRYVWYVGSLFYDGYPLFLDHVDEWILRPLFSLSAALHELTGLPTPDSPSREELFYWSRALRVFYGLLVVLMAGLAARLLGLSRRLSFLCAGLMAIAPLSITVTHSATGDVATDLFTACVILCTGWYARRKTVLPLFMAAIAVGFAFAGKYQGMLSAGIIFGFLFLESLLAERRMGPLFRRLLLVLAGIMVSVLVAVPQFFIDAERTWRDMWGNFVFIKNYNVSAAFLKLPLWERISQSFSTNAPWILQALGWSMIVTALLACGLAAAVLLRAWRERTAPDRQVLFATAVAFFPFAALLLSLTGKPQVQAFHFSFLQLPLCLAAVWAISRLASSTRLLVRGLAVVVALWMVIELGAGARHETFFWRREELQVVAKAIYNELLDETKVPEKCPQTVRTMRLEQNSLPAFRNSGVKVPVKNGLFWNTIGIAPWPSVPLPGDHYWIFCNGPIFPRNDRMFHVPAGERTEKGLIFPYAPTSMTLAVQAGLWPSETVITLGGQKQVVRLASYENKELIFTPLKHRWLVSNSCFVACSAKSSVGDTWITILPERRDQEHYRLWNGSGSLPTQPIPEAIIPHLNSARYLEGVNGVGQYLKDGKTITLSENTPSAAGIYRLNCEVFLLSTNTVVELSVTNQLFGTSSIQYLSPTMPAASPQIITRTFSKTFLPYTVDLKIHCVTGQCMIGRWELKPETQEIITSLNQGISSRQKPAWLQTSPIETQATTPGPLAGIVFGRSVELLDVQVPSTLASNTATLYCAMKLNRYPFRHFGEYFAFIHLVDSQDELRAVVTIPLWQAAASEKQLYPIEWAVPADLPRGEYSLWMGIYNGRTEKRMDISLPRNLNVAMDDDKVLIGHTSRLK